MLRRENGNCNCGAIHHDNNLNIPQFTLQLLYTGRCVRLFSGNSKCKYIRYIYILKSVVIGNDICNEGGL